MIKKKVKYFLDIGKKHKKIEVEKRTRYGSKI